MAEAALLSVALGVASTVTSSAFEKAFEKACFILEAKEELKKIAESIATIKGGLLDAEKKQENDSVKGFIKRVRFVLYEAEELIDEVNTNELLKQQMDPILCIPKEVQVYFSKLNPILTSYSIANKVGTIREKLMTLISNEMTMFDFAHRIEDDTKKVTRDTGAFVDKKKVFGRDKDMKVILGFLYKENCSLIAIVGIGGMGKSSLAQLVYNDEKIIKEFGNERRWWACISNTCDEKEVTGKIYQSMTGKDWKNKQLQELQSKITKHVSKNEKFFLVLDDLWDRDTANWDKILSLLTSGGEVKSESKIIVTTRSPVVAKAMKVGKSKTHMLKGLTNEASWELFKSIAFVGDEEIDSNKVRLGREIVKKGANVPLAIQCIGNILRRKDTVEEWNSFAENELPEISPSEDPEYVMSVLKLSYDSLSSELKRCFAYCSLFPKRRVLDKKKLIYLWMAQGFLKPYGDERLEEAGHGCFMDLLRGGFFEEEKVDDDGVLVGCKMHDLIHDLARQVDGDESIMLVDDGFSQFDDEKLRHVSVGHEIDSSWNIPPPLRKPEFMRSFLVLPRNYTEPLVIDEAVMELRLLRALSLEGSSIKDVPSSIGELRYLRYLNLSRNKNLVVLPDSITKLVNLLTLDLSGCSELRVLPKDFRKLINLRHLDITHCLSLKYMPYGFGKLTSLQHLSDFKVSKRGGDDLNALIGLNLHGELSISYDPNDGWVDDEMMIDRGHIPEKIDELSIYCYLNSRIRAWWNENHTTPLPIKRLKLKGCKKVKYLPSFRRLLCLEKLVLDDLEQLEYMEEEEAISDAPFFPSLAFLELIDLPKLEGWSRLQEAATTLSFPLLSRLSIHNCSLLKSMPHSPRLLELSMVSATKETVQQLVSTTSADSSSSLESITITSCNDLKSFPGEGLTSLRRLELRGCDALENVELASNASVEELTIVRCPKLKLWDHGDEKPGLDLGNLVNLRVLGLGPDSKELPNWLGQRVGQGLLQIKKIK